jgi:cell wall-associated NlpC family hydrolase
MAKAALRPGVIAATHRVSALRTLVFERPDMKAPALMDLSMNARVSRTGEEGPFSRIDGSGYVFTGHLAPLGAVETDYVAVAERFLGTPYLWGGRESLGLDCSGLVQVSMAACGVDVLRDSDMQAATIGTAVDPGPALGGVKRGDLIFWPGHVAIMLDATRIIHASGRMMMVEIEPLAQAVARILPVAGAVKVVKRP